MEERIENVIEQMEETARVCSSLAKNLKEVMEGNLTDEKAREVFNLALNLPLKLDEAEEQIKEFIDYVVNRLKEVRSEETVFTNTSLLYSLSGLLYSIADLISLYQQYRVYGQEHLVEEIYEEIERLSEKI